MQVTDGKTVIGVAWEHYNSRRPGRKITLCKLRITTPDGENEYETAAKIQNVSKDAARKVTMGTLLLENIPSKGLRRKVWEAYLQRK